MPYNTNAIPPRKEVTGQPALPLARVKKIIAQDPDIGLCSNNAAFEMFVQYLANEGQNQAKLDRKPRRNVQYKDLANAVAHNDNLEFLEDVIPKTIPYKQIRDQAAISRTAPKKSNAEPKKRQSTNGVNGAAAAHENDQPEAQSARAPAEDGDVDMTG
ncbi:histone-like transcription factor and archaeal histone [Colletotrichum karsti]|uniref:Histone-like transcription factor and archaeal histone n=1 Tax=Colletotrichum karsti TaxID=1095194 RepID=A0A9P6IF98_9PEZI|nr:histone-like transcription factor and archaeal histone [Colletotrichum karsti]KAF9881748.1 histone-like transcription factor and archaeal histone [Colletotrichum karsti]